MYCPPAGAADLFRRAAGISALIFDVDGVFTDGQIVYDTAGEETKYYNALDGFAAKLAKTAAIRLGIISARESEAIRHRAGELGITTLFLGRFDKAAAYAELKQSRGLSDADICFVGDDLPDLPVLRLAGLPVIVSNAAALLKDEVPFITRRAGGRGALREVLEFILHAQGRLETVVEDTLRRLG